MGVERGEVCHILADMIPGSSRSSAAVDGGRSNGDLLRIELPPAKRSAPPSMVVGRQWCWKWSRPIAPAFPSAARQGGLFFSPNPGLR